jgi:YD repeat-containing protein
LHYTEGYEFAPSGAIGGLVDLCGAQTRCDRRLYGYDANGNQTSRTVGGVTYTFTYDRENRLTAVSGGSVSATFVYDADGCFPRQRHRPWSALCP